MKKRLAAAIVVATTAVANAGTIPTPSGQYLWQGDIFITSNINPAKNPNLCTSMGNNVGKFAQAVFAPRGQGGNDTTQDKLMLFISGEFSGMYWVSNNNSGLLNKAKSVTSSGIDQGGFYTGTLNGTFSFPTPPAPTAVGSSTVTASFTINAKDTKTGQTCTFTASGHLAGPF